MAVRVRSTVDFGKVRAAYSDALPEALQDAAEEIGTLSDARAPIDTGNMADTRYVRVDADAGRAEIGYTAYYAPIQHERTDYQHEGGRRAKFLETAMVDARATAANALAVRLRRGLGT